MKATLTQLLFSIALMLSIPLCLLSQIIEIPHPSPAHDFEATNPDGVTIYYKKISDTECQVTHYGSNEFSSKYQGEITIPSKVHIKSNWYLNVTSIGDYAFASCDKLTSIILPNSIKSIGNCAFFGCRWITSIKLPSSVTSIGEEAFENCSSLTTFSFPQSTQTIGKGTFSGCASLTSINLPNGLTSIGKEAFLCCYKLSSLTIPSSVTFIGEEAFHSCSVLTSLTIPSSVSKIGDRAFDCYVTVDSDNPNYASQDGVLFNKKKTTLLRFPLNAPASFSGSNYSVPNGVISIRPCAFAGCHNLHSITLPNSLTSINNEAFEGCKNLTSITFPNTIRYIGLFAFSGCSSLSSVTFLGNFSPQIESAAFLDIHIPATLHVPTGTKSKYINLQDFFSSIIEY